jgi:hypothetical protein
VPHAAGFASVGLLLRSVVAAFTLVLLSPSLVTAQATDSALARFNQAVADYVSLVPRLHREVPELRVTEKTTEINNRSDMLAGAI